MEFTRDGDNLSAGGGGFGSGLAIGSALNRDRDDGKMVWMAAIVIVIIFIFAIIALALFNADKRKSYGSDTDVAGLLATVVAAKGVGKDENYRACEIMAKLEHNEDRQAARQTQAEIGALGLMLQKTSSDNEMRNLHEFGEVKQKLGMLEMGLTQVLQYQNNKNIVDATVQQLMLMPNCRT